MKSKTGVLLINLGTPDATDVRSMWRYLREFMSDRRVIERRGPLWWLLLHAVILPRRVGKARAAYRQIWNRGLDESPLRTISRSQAGLIAREFAAGGEIEVGWAMRYGRPPIGEAMARLTGSGCRRILVFPLYPQYSAATTGSVMDEVFRTMQAMRAQPSIRTVPPYFDSPAFIDALARSIETHERSLEWRPDIRVLSFHGLPKAFVEKGDPYQDQCEATAAALRARLGLDRRSMPLVYQSRPAGRAEWLEPRLEETLAEIAAGGAGRVTVTAPGFCADCIETLEEIEIRAARRFLAAGGEQFSYVPCLNDAPPAVSFMAGIIAGQLLGWVETTR